nr:cupin domain-containing protein [Frankia sp. Cr2]
MALGGDVTAGQQPQAHVPGGVWQAATLAGQTPVLVSCVVAPGFEFADFRLAGNYRTGPAGDLEPADSPDGRWLTSIPSSPPRCRHR